MTTYDYNWSEEKPGHSIELGYGRLNAFFAVEAAQSMLTSGVDLFIKDTPDEFGVEPNEISEIIYLSEDIWVRNQDDGFINQFHENPEYTIGQPVYVYVRVRNRGCDASLGTEQLKLYWAKAATALTWPAYWNGSITTPALMGDIIGTEPIDIIEGGDEKILKFEWNNIPNPTDYNLINEQPWHFCLLSRIVAENDTMNDELNDGTWNLGHNVKYNNNIAWKNLSIIDIIPGIVGGPFEDDKIVGATVAVGNASNTTNTFDLHFNVPSQYLGNPITQASEVRLTLDEKTWQKWQAGSFINSNIKITRADRRQVLIESANASIKNLTYGPKERSSINVSFNVLTSEMTGKAIFEYNVVQTLANTDSILGGERYKVKLPLRDAFTANAGIDERIVIGDSVTLQAAVIAEPAIFNWYNESDSIIHTGPITTVAPNNTSVYKLEVIASSDGFKDYDTKEVEVLMGLINSISPNPSADFVNVAYRVAASANAKLMLVNAFDGSTSQFSIDSNLNHINLDLSSFPLGVYSLSLVVNGYLVDQKGIVIE